MHESGANDDRKPLKPGAGEQEKRNYQFLAGSCVRKQGGVQAHAPTYSICRLTFLPMLIAIR